MERRAVRAPKISGISVAQNWQMWKERREGSAVRHYGLITWHIIVWLTMPALSVKNDRSDG